MFSKTIAGLAVVASALSGADAFVTAPAGLSLRPAASSAAIRPASGLVGLNMANSHPLDVLERVRLLEQSKYGSSKYEPLKPSSGTGHLTVEAIPDLNKEDAKDILARVTKMMDDKFGEGPVRYDGPAAKASQETASDVLKRVQAMMDEKAKTTTAAPPREETASEILARVIAMARD